MRPRSIPPILATMLLAAAISWAPGRVSASPSGTLSGIDVSHWDGAIAWTRVASSGVRFVIMKATDGISYVDPSYARNLAGATAAGIAVGSYDFAEPSTRRGAAAAEADHFIQVARNAPGDLLPALDLERTNGLTTSQLQTWVKQWLAEVVAKIGVRPMIYASPAFWTYFMGNTQWFANNGYTTLWIAHWGVSSPTVPANDWGGRGWTFWQWTNCWHVNGISGCVDGDRYHGTDLIRGEIAKLTVATSGGGAVTGPRISCGDGRVGCSRLANPNDSVALTAVADPGAAFVGWGGACTGAGTSPTCTVTTTGRVKAPATFGFPISVTEQGTGAGTVISSPAGISCGTSCQSVYPSGTKVTLTATPDSASGFGTWGGACQGSQPTCTLTISGPVNLSAGFDAAISLDQTGPGTRFSWGRRIDRRALGGSYLVDERPGSSETFTFTGGTVCWYTIDSPAMGRASVSIDGVPKGTFSGYASSFRAGVQHVFNNLGSGAHSITITALGTRSSRARGTQVAVDAITAAGGLRLSPRPSTGGWSLVSAPQAQGGTYVVNSVPGAAASIWFSGTGLSWTTVRGAGMGLAQEWVDGKLVRTVDLSATTPAYGVVRTISGLPDGRHIVRIVALGAPGANGHGKVLAIDGWTIR